MTDALIPPWHPISDPVDLKYLGKYAEELFEVSDALSTASAAASKAGQAACRCIIQGLDEVHPVTGKSNKRWLEEEIGDVLANIELVIGRFELSNDVIAMRVAEKLVKLKTWHEGA